VLADGGAHILATLAEDPNLRDTLAGGATAAKMRAAKRLSRARKAMLAEYRGDLLAR
jgi:hypothetical protein